MIKDAAGREWMRQDIEILSREVPDGSGSGYLAARLLLMAYDRVEALEGALKSRGYHTPSRHECPLDGYVGLCDKCEPALGAPAPGEG